MSNFSDYIKNNDTIKSGKTESLHNYTNDDLQSMIDKYSCLSDDKLINEFMRLTIEKKQRGELSDAQLNDLKVTIMPMLNDQQKDALNRLIQLVKNV